MKPKNKKVQGKDSKSKNTKQSNRSHIGKDGEIYLKNAGRYNEVTKESIGKVRGTSIGD